MKIELFPFANLAMKINNLPVICLSIKRLLSVKIYIFGQRWSSLEQYDFDNKVTWYWSMTLDQGNNTTSFNMQPSTWMKLWYVFFQKLQTRHETKICKTDRKEWSNKGTNGHGDSNPLPLQKKIKQLFCRMYSITFNLMVDLSGIWSTIAQDSINLDA